MEQYLSDLLSVFRRNPATLIGLVIVVFISVLSIIAPLVAPFDPEEPNSAFRLLPPSSKFWFGTDVNGFDIFSRTIYAPRLDLVIAIAATSLSIIIGTPLGMVAGFYSRVVSDVIMRLADILQAFPTLILALALVSATSQGITTVIYVIAILNAPIYLRLIRAQVLSLREALFVEAAKAAGNPDWRILWRHMLPSAVPPVLIQSAINVGWAILLTASLAFLGIGISPPTPEWGSMINIGARNMITGQWWVAFFPGLVMGVCILGFNLLAEAFQEALDPTQA